VEVTYSALYATESDGNDADDGNGTAHLEGILAHRRFVTDEVRDAETFERGGLKAIDAVNESAQGGSGQRPSPRGSAGAQRDDRGRARPRGGQGVRRDAVQQQSEATRNIAESVGKASETAADPAGIVVTVGNAENEATEGVTNLETLVTHLTTTASDPEDEARNVRKRLH